MVLNIEFKPLGVRAQIQILDVIQVSLRAHYLARVSEVLVFYSCLIFHLGRGLNEFLIRLLRKPLVRNKSIEFDVQMFAAWQWALKELTHVHILLILIHILKV